MKLGRNDPCRCGSGKKYKRCHLDEDDLAERAALAQEAAVEDVPEGEEGEAAKELAEFIQPILSASGRRVEDKRRAAELGILFWNAAIAPEGERKTMLDDFARNLRNDGSRKEFRELAEMMLERHQSMFPDLHGGGDEEPSA